MTKKFFLILLIPLFLLSACSKDYINDSEGQIPLPHSSAILADGTYYATYGYANNEGYRPEMTIVVNEGLISSIKYLEISNNGKDKISDVEYYENFKEKHNIDIQGIYLRLYTNLIKNQNTSNLPSTGDFPDIRSYFKQLADVIILKAKKGITEPSVVAMDEVYYGDTNTDDNGYKGSISITYVNDVIIDVEYSELNLDGDHKEDVDDLNEIYQEHYGISLGEMFDSYARQIVQNGTLQPVDSMSGATRTQEKVNELLKIISNTRIKYEGEEADD